MGYPVLEIDLEKIRLNTAHLVGFCHRMNIEVMGVTKGVCALAPIVKAFYDGGIRKFGDSRLQNIKTMRDSGFKHPIYLLRIPMPSEAEDVVGLATGSFNSEIETIKRLSAKSSSNKTKHKVILMVDVGDRREGIMPEDLLDFVKQILELPGIELEGLGTNVACFGGVLPDKNNVGILFDLAEQVRKRFGIALQTISGGNTATLPLVEKEGQTLNITQLRLGEAILLGKDTSNYRDVPGTSDKTIRLLTEVIEVKVKPSLPQGHIGRSAFGVIPVYKDTGPMLRAITALGRQDCIIEGIKPLDKAIKILGASSDHLLLDINQARHISVGSLVEFEVSYAAMISLMLSNYIEKRYVTIT